MSNNGEEPPPAEELFEAAKNREVVETDTEPDKGMRHLAARVGWEEDHPCKWDKDSKQEGFATELDYVLRQMAPEGQKAP